MPRRLQLVVNHTGNVIRYYPVSFESGGWHVNSATREIVIGKGVPREFVPLDNVLSYRIEEVQNADQC